LFAIASNLAGRITLNQIFGYTAVYAFAQMLGLPVFVRLLEEACLLQIQGSRIRNEYQDNFESGPILSALRLLTAGLAILIWTITFTNNLNIFSYVYGVIHDFLALTRTIGSIYFSFGGILLFLGIIWLANFLQKYIGYFFGDTGDEAGFNNKGQRSRLMITRLVLLISGFLIAVAASGLPVDKITVVLGALGVGIGLGLQGIVNNFVSGVILIFDRPLRIGDTVEVGDKKGRVKEISIRSSTLLTAEGAEVIIPNGDLLSHNIVNWTLSNNHIRIDLPITVDKVPDPEALQQAFLELMKKTENVLQERAPEILFTNIKGNAVQLDFLFWCDDVTRVDNTRSEARKAIYNLLREKEMAIM
jgi:potassium efflux system protein